MAVYAPALMLQQGDPMADAIGFWPAVLYVVVKALIAIVLNLLLPEELASEATEEISGGMAGHK